MNTAIMNHLKEEHSDNEHDDNEPPVGGGCFEYDQLSADFWSVFVSHS